MSAAANKCKQVKFLGKIVSADGVAVNPDSIGSVKKWPTPRNRKEVESFIGFVNYHRDHIEQFAEIAEPLHRLTGPKAEFAWNEEQTQSFQNLKEALINSVILSYPTPDDLFILDTDASQKSIGAELSQIQDGVERTVSFARQLARWIEELSQYNMIIQHRAGKKHINADGLSRKPDDIEACRNYRPDVNLEELPCGGCKFCTRARQQWQTFEEEVDFVVPLTIRRLVDDGSYNTNWTPSYSPVELHEEQMKDSDLKTLKRWIEDKYEPTKAELKLCSEVVRHFWSLRQQIQIKDNILLYKWEDPISPRLLFMTPKQMQIELLHGCHDVSRLVTWDNIKH
ncbi:Hypothetical predicted protein [Mytilus galloprovincialis]|uniref:Reverse transcriptase/retrotransposon-derived protein RNase H-like domain-containing protein n=1 Tax=Mytilus galloprovincialis TaxID=29158 RepID=A0A8B6FA34_MYTGA|nr:Hypothetical predicted protein [Mytilus galloprovincialis]